MIRKMRLRQWQLWGLCFFSVMALSLAVLWPGTSGPFIFDDYLNIARLSQKGCVDDHFSFLWYIFGGHNATGRPLSYLSFLLQDFCWPTDPRPMKVFNLFWHLLNFVLLTAFLKQLFRISRIDVSAWAALALAAIWVVHPVNVSAIFLTVQRMTLMMSTCILLGMMAWLRGRELVAAHPVRGHVWMWGGLGFGGIIGSLFKETAIGMPFFVLAVELTLLRGLPRGGIRSWRLFVACCLLFPIFAAIAYVVIDPQGLVGHHWLRRPYTGWEKVLTEFRVLFLYVKEILLPDMTRLGVYHDSIQPSSGLVSPPVTLLAIMGWVVLLGLAWWKRRAWPLFSLGILWFFGGHFLEAMLLPLELYFEHRNYLPGLGLLIAILGIWRARPVRRGWHAIAVMLPLILLFSFISYASAGVWSDRDRLVVTWYAENPESQRAVQSYIKYLLREKEFGKAQRILQEYAWHNENADLAIKARALYLSCPPDLDERWRRLVGEAYGISSRASMARTLNDVILHQMECPRLTTNHLRAMVKALLSNPAFSQSPKLRQSLFLLYSYTYVHDKRLDLAMYFADIAYNENPDPEIAKTQAIWLVEAGLYDPALEYIDKALNTPERVKFITLKGDPRLISLKHRVERLKRLRSGANG